MAHIPYYGEEETPTRKNTKSLRNFQEVLEHNFNFASAFIDLKVVGWKSFSQALDNYTLGAYHDGIKQLDEHVEITGENMKKILRPSIFRRICQ